MRALGIDISHNKTKSAFDMFKHGRIFQYVIAVCDEASERCPIFPSAIKRLSWSFPDPAALQGTFEEKLKQAKLIRDRISSQIENWLTEVEES